MGVGVGHAAPAGGFRELQIQTSQGGERGSAKPRGWGVEIKGSRAERGVGGRRGRWAVGEKRGRWGRKEGRQPAKRQAGKAMKSPHQAALQRSLERSRTPLARVDLILVRPVQIKDGSLGSHRQACVSHNPVHG